MQLINVPGPDDPRVPVIDPGKPIAPEIPGRIIDPSPTRDPNAPSIPDAPIIDPKPQPQPQPTQS